MSAIINTIYVFSLSGFIHNPLFIKTFRSVYKELHADHETGAADNK